MSVSVQVSLQSQCQYMSHSNVGISKGLAPMSVKDSLQPQCQYQFHSNIGIELENTPISVSVQDSLQC